MIARSIILLLTAMILSGCRSTLPVEGMPPVGTYRVPTTTSYNLIRRSFLLYLPTGYDSGKPLPLVLVLHGAFSSAGQTEEETGFSRLAEQEKFIVAYPEGVGLFGLFQHWNAGHCCGPAVADGVDDVAFLDEVVTAVRQRFAVDANRIYLAGMSNGGMLAYRYGSLRAGGLAGIAVVSGAAGSSAAGGEPSLDLALPGTPVAVIGLHGLADESIPVAGSNGTGGGRSYLPVAAAVDFWGRANGCVQPLRRPAPGIAATELLSFGECRSGRAVEFYLLPEWGHRWPAPYFTGQLPAGHPLRNFDATAEIWRFFRRSDSPAGAGK